MNSDLDIPTLSKETLITNESSRSANDLWSKISSKLKEDLGGELFELWLKPVQPLGLLSDSAETINKKFAIEVPNKIFSDWISQRVQEKIENLLKEFFQSEVSLAIILPKESAMDLEAPVQIFPPSATITIKEKVDPSFSIAQFNPKYTFASFIEGETNRFAKAAAEGVSKEPGVRFNPLFIYGSVGLGKTHLMHAIGHSIFQNHPNARILYLSSEKFINEFINSLRYERPSDFRNKYRNLDCLLIDDIQFLMGKGKSEEEFFFTFNTLFDSRKQIVISSDRPPKEMGSLQERLISRFEWGVVADIQPADLETRIAILRKKAELERIFVPDDVMFFIASQVKSNIRELEGALIRTVAYSSLTSTPLTIDMTRSTLKDILKREEPEKPIDMDLIQEVVAKHFSLNPKELKSKRRTDAIAWPRQIAMYLARTLTDLSTTEIGGFYGGKDHTTVLHACEKVKLKMAESPFVSSLINKITHEIKSDGSN